MICIKHKDLDDSDRGEIRVCAGNISALPHPAIEHTTQKTGERRIEERAGRATTPTIPPAAKTTKKKKKPRRNTRTTTYIQTGTHTFAAATKTGMTKSSQNLARTS